MPRRRRRRAAHLEREQRVAAEREEIGVAIRPARGRAPPPRRRRSRARAAPEYGLRAAPPGCGRRAAAERARAGAGAGAFPRDLAAAPPAIPMRSGVRSGPSSRSQCASSASSSQAAPGSATTNATIVSPNQRSGTPTAAASRTPGCWASTSSISRGAILWPPLMTISFERPVTKKKPSASRWPRSPVRRNPSGVRGGGALAAPSYSWIRRGLRIAISPVTPAATSRPSGSTTRASTRQGMPTLPILRAPGSPGSVPVGHRIREEEAARLGGSHHLEQRNPEARLEGAMLGRGERRRGRSREAHAPGRSSRRVAAGRREELRDDGGDQRKPAALVPGDPVPVTRALEAPRHHERAAAEKRRQQDRGLRIHVIEREHARRPVVLPERMRFRRRPGARQDLAVCVQDAPRASGGSRGEVQERRVLRRRRRAQRLEGRCGASSRASSRRRRGGWGRSSAARPPASRCESRRRTRGLRTRRERAPARAAPRARRGPRARRAELPRSRHAGARGRSPRWRRRSRA